MANQMQALLASRPKYKIADGYNENVLLSRNRANGRDRAILNQENNIKEATASNVAQAQQSSSSGSGVLNALSAINANQADAYRQTAAQESQIKTAAQGDLMAANQALGEEKDKQFEYDVAAPYAQRVNELALKNKRKREMITKGLSTVGSVVGTIYGGPAGGAIGSTLGESLGGALTQNY